MQLQLASTQRGVQLKLDRLNTVLQENLAGARLVKAFVRDAHESRRFATANADYTQRNVEVMQFLSMLPPVLTLFVNIGMVVVVYFGGLRGIAGELTVGQIMAFYNYLLNTLNPLILTGLLANTWANGIASARRINEVLDHIPEVQDRQDAGDLPEPVRFLQVACTIAYYHHERWDGTGYPRGLAGEAIPRPARLMALADVYDALTTARVYKAAWSREATARHIAEQAGAHFDPAVVAAFVAIRDEFEAIANRLAD